MKIKDFYGAKELQELASTIDTKYQLNALQNKSSNPNLIQFNSNHANVASSTSARPAINLANANSIYMYSPLKTNHQSQNFYSTPARYDLSTSSLAYLPTSSANGRALFFPNSNSQHNATSISTATLPTTGYLATTPAFADIAYGALNGKNPYTATNLCINGLKKRKRRYKKPVELRRVLPKNSLMLLHEYRPNIEYRFLCQSGPIHRPLFTMCVDISEHKFEGTGKTKKEARMQAAERALEFLLQHPEYIQKSTSSTAGSTLTASNSEKSSNESSNNLENNTDEEDEDDEESVSENSSHNFSSPTENNEATETELVTEESSSKRFKKEDEKSDELKNEHNIS